MSSLSDTFSMMFGSDEDECLICGATEDLIERQRANSNDTYFICRKCEREQAERLVAEQAARKAEHDLLDWIAKTDN